MGITSLTHTTLIVPRSDLPSVARELVKFEWFHSIASEVRNLDPTVDELAQRAFRLYIDLDELVKRLEIQIQPGIMDMLAKGYKVESEEYSVKSWQDMVEKVEAEADTILEEVRSTLAEDEVIKKKLSDDRTLKDAIQLISGFSVDLAAITALRRIHVVFALVSMKDLREIRRSLPEAIIIDSPLTKSQSAVLIGAPTADAERIEKTLRSFEVKAFTIPPELPQNPSEAYKVVEKHISESEEISVTITKDIKRMIERIRQKLLVLHETSKMAHGVLDQIRRSGELKRFGIVKGYIPSSRQGLFKERFAQWICLTKDVRHGERGGEKHVPTLSTNSGVTKAFENITLNQGLPNYGEVDPTPLISVIFPIFFGIMFADLGHGLVLFFFSLFLYVRGNQELKRWGTIFMLAGASASVAGVMIGEFFGLGIKKLIPPLGSFEVLEVVDHAHHSLNLESIMTLLMFSWILGIIHIGIGLALNVVKGIREKDRLDLAIEKIPNFFLYVFSVMFGLSFIGAGLTFGGMLTSSEPLPLLPFLTTTQGTIISLSGALPLIGVLMFGKVVAIKMGKLQGETLLDALMMNPIEVLFEKLPGFLAGTISYARLGILLVVHAALLISTNAAWQMGLAGLPIIIIANILIILLEAMIVYIQTLRLHLYEWFTKFYDGGGEAFRKLAPSAVRVKLNWEETT